MRGAIVAGLALLALAVAVQPARAYYVARVGATAQARAATLPAGPVPIVQLVGRTATVTWPSVAIPGGGAVPAYAVLRAAAGPSAPVPAGGTCADTVRGLTCTEPRLPAGTWTYAVTPRAGRSWSGAAGPPSATFVVAAPALALAGSNVGGTLPRTVVGTLTGFDTGEAVTWRLDDATTGRVLAGTAAVGADGAAAVEVVVPAGTAEGPHAVYAVGTGPAASQARAEILVDVTPPRTTDSSAAIGPAWRTSATVLLTPSDAGSGVEATYWTADGSAPTTSSSRGTSVALTADGIHTVRYFSVDRAGNREAEQTAATAIRIDATPPTASAPETGSTVIRGGATITAAAADPTANGVASGVAEVAYYACAGTCTPAPGDPGTLRIGASASGPAYAVSWPSTPLDGFYSIAARATDAAGNAAMSTAVLRTVDTAPPIIAATLADATAQQAGYINGKGSFYAYANVVDTGTGPDPSSVRADLSAQCGAACASVALSGAGGPFTVLTATGPATYAYRSALQRAVSSPGTSFAVTAADLAGTAGSATGVVTIDQSGSPGAPTAVTLASGAVATGFAGCAITPNGYVNAARAGTATVQVQTAANAPADGVVSLTVSDGTASVSAMAVSPGAGAQTVTFANLDLTRLADGAITLRAFEYTPGGKLSGGARTQSVTKLTAAPAVTTANLAYTDNVAPIADQASSVKAVGPAGGFLSFTQTAGAHVGATFASGVLSGGVLAAMALASETASPTYAVRAVDAACNQSAAATWTPPAAR